MKLSGIIAAGIALAPTFVVAAAYTGSGPGTSTIGSGGDYATLGAAATAINANALTGGDWTFEFLDGAHTQTASVYMLTPTNGNRLIFKPAAGATATVTFGGAGTLTGSPSGHWVIGALTNVVNTTLMQVTIDGNNGTSNNALILQNGTGGGNLLRIINNCDNLIIRNATLRQLSTSTASRHTIALTSYADVSTQSAPDNVLIENNTLEATAGALATCVYTDQNQTTPVSTDLVTNLIVRNNTISGRARGVYLCTTDGTSEVYGNTITVTQGTPTQPAYGIQVLQNNSPENPANSGIFNFYNNTIRATAAMTDAADVCAGVSFDFGGNGSDNPTYNVYNNAITAQLTAGASGASAGCNGIRLAHANTHSSFQHNSIHIQNSSSLYTGMDETEVNCIALTPDALTGTHVVRNNVLRNAHPNGVALFIGKQPDATATVTASHNDLYAAAGMVGRAGTGTTGSPSDTNFATLGVWQDTTAYGANSVSVDPMDTAGGTVAAWTSATNLKLTPHTPATMAPNATLVGAPTATTTISTDIDGQARYASKPTMGADEIPGFHVPVSMSGFAIE